MPASPLPVSRAFPGHPAAISAQCPKPSRLGSPRAPAPRVTGALIGTRHRSKTRGSHNILPRHASPSFPLPTTPHPVHHVHAFSAARISSVAFTARFDDRVGRWVAGPAGYEMPPSTTTRTTTCGVRPVDCIVSNPNSDNLRTHPRIRIRVPSNKKTDGRKRRGLHWAK